MTLTERAWQRVYDKMVLELVDSGLSWEEADTRTTEILIDAAVYMAKTS